MMKYYCKCLNVCVQLNEILSCISFENEEYFSEEEKNHEFFKQLPVAETLFNEIFVQQSFLIKAEIVSSWIVYKCINCTMYLYATKNYKGRKITLINNLLMQINDEELQNIKESVDYSPAFRIIISSISSASISNTFETSQQLEDCNNNYILELKKELMANIDKKSKITEELIQNFINEQQNYLKEYIIRANDDFQILKNILSNDQKKSISSYHDGVYETDIKNFSNDTKEIFTSTDDNSHKSIKIPYTPEIEVTREKELFAIDIPPSFDSEGLFPLDDMEENIILEDDDHSEDDLSDTDDSGSRDEGIHIPRRKSIAFARSLPIKVPSDFDSSLRLFDGRMEDQKGKPNYKQKRNEPPLDIAASIKALANSVHGDTIFGDLPPPRIGSRI
ncbi:hypothetical protein PGB90_010241 [Kerria lacca]